MLERLDRIGRSRLAAGGLVLAGILFLSANLLATTMLRDLRLDLTAERLFTLSEGTRDTLAGLDEPLRLRLYLSQALLRDAPQLSAHAARVREMLETYTALSDGRILLEVIDPEPFSPEEDRAVAFGLEGTPINAAGERAFFGLVGTNATDDREVIPFFAPERERFLEYDLTRLVHALGSPGKPVVALIDGLGLSGGPADGFRPMQVLEQMKQFFEVRTLGGDLDAIPADAAVLMVVHPQGLSDKTLYAIDQHVLKGGRLLVFVDPHAETQQGPRGLPAEDTGSDLEALFAAWGIRFTAGEIVADRANAMAVRTVAGGRPVVAPYAAWFGVGREELAAEDAITGQLSTLTFTSAGAFTLAEGEGESKSQAQPVLTPLVTSSADAGTVDAALARLDGNPGDLLKGFAPAGTPFTLAARLSGTLESAFPDGRPGGEGSEGHITRSEVPANVVLVGDADLLADRNWLQIRSVLGQRIAVPFANNGDFVVNALETLAGGQALAGLRGRGLSHRPFDRVLALEAEAERRFRATERDLSAKLEETERKLAGIGRTEAADGADGQAILTPEQQTAIETFRGEMLAIRAQLRDVQHALRRDIERLETWVSAVNIAGVPGLVVLAALGWALWRPRRRIRPRTA
jgi:ABC-type uncharacterized transport system involved in gliding motility auxiliary subunit